MPDESIRLAVLNDAFDARRRNGWRTSYPEFKGALATGLAGVGQLDEALVAVNEGLDGAVQGEHGHDLFFAELLRIKGEILFRREAAATAEDSFLAAIDGARQQEALFWELRAALSLALLRVTQGRGGEARQLLAQVYDRFTEGFGTPRSTRRKSVPGRTSRVTHAHSGRVIPARVRSDASVSWQAQSRPLRKQGPAIHAFAAALRIA